MKDKSFDELLAEQFGAKTEQPQPKPGVEPTRPAVGNGADPLRDRLVREVTAAIDRVLQEQTSSLDGGGRKPSASDAFDIDLG